MSALAAYRTGIRSLLDDASSDRFTDGVIDESLELALVQYSQRKPLLRTYVLDSTNSKRITLPADFIAMSIVDVELVSSLADFDDRIAFYAYKPDEQWVIETPGNVIPLGETLNVYYNAPHTIDGFASASGTTVPDSDEELVELGAAGYACIARATSKVETNNLNPQEAKDLAANGREKLDQFFSLLVTVEMPFVHSTWHDQTIDKNF